MHDNGSGPAAAGKKSFVIDGMVDVSLATPLRTLLLETLEGCESLAVDAAGVTGIDTAGLQLLLALDVSAARRGLTVTGTGASPALVAAAAASGVALPSWVTAAADTEKREVGR